MENPSKSVNSFTPWNSNGSGSGRDFADVIVVGGGPVGAALAGDLGTRGIRCILLEMTDGVFRDPRMHAVNIRTMEMARRWGLKEKIRNAGWPADHPQDICFLTSLDGFELGRIPWPAIMNMSEPPESPAHADRCPQSWFNPIMLDFANRQSSVDVRLQWRFEELRLEENSVVVIATDLSNNSKVEIQSAFLIGCDGSRSPVRESAGIRRRVGTAMGRAAEAIFRSAELADFLEHRRAGRYTIIGRSGMSASLLPYDGKDLFRLTLMVEPGNVSDEQMRQAIRSLSARPFNFELVTPSLPWVNREMCVETFRAGRILLAGDAAHSMPPTGGFGMNTGLIDAWDLGWKLEAVLKGWGGQGLLDGYSVERTIASERTAKMASAIYGDWVRMKSHLAEDGNRLIEPDEAGQKYRDEIGRYLTKTFQREFNPIGGALGYSYEGSPICVGETGEAPEDDLIRFIPTTRSGHRAPHAWLSPDLSTLDLFGEGFVLFDLSGKRLGDPLLSAARKRGIPLKMHSFASDGEIAKLYERSLVLVRPDGFVCWRGDDFVSNSPDDILDIVCGWRTPTQSSDRGTHLTFRADADASG